MRPETYCCNTWTAEEYADYFSRTFNFFAEDKLLAMSIAMNSRRINLVPEYSDRDLGIAAVIRSSELRRMLLSENNIIRRLNGTTDVTKILKQLRDLRFHDSLVNSNYYRFPNPGRRNKNSDKN